MTITNNQDLIYLANTSLFVQDYNNEYIYISEMPDYLGKGKNSFLIGIRRNCFEPNTLLNVFFLDKNGHSIPVVVTEYKQRMMIRCYIQIDQSYPVGFGTFVVIGCLSSYNNAPVPANQKLKANIKYQKQIYVNPYEKTPSALRLRHKPDIKLFVDQKKLYKYDMKTQSEYLNISNISIDEQHNDFICLQIDTASISQSIYYEKFINYKVVDNINEVTGFNTIFSGSIVTTDYLPTLGEYYGHLHSVNGESVLDYGDVKIEGGLLQLGNISNNQIQLLTGKNINQLNIDFLVEGKSSLFGKYYIYLENQNFLNIQNLQLGQSSSKIKQIQYVSKIDKANNISLVTHYLSGSVNISGGLFSENLLIVTGSQPILGSYKNFEIKNPDIFEKQEILSGQLKNNYQITHSNQNIMVNATGKTILTNCFLQNTYIGHKNSTDITTFDYIEGKLFSTNLFTTQQENSLGNSYFSGSLKGVGKFYTKTSGSSLYANNELINIYDSESLIQIQLDYLFIGDGYNANLQIEQFTGSIYSSSLIDQQYYLYDYYPEITYSKMLIESSKFKLNVLNINNLEIVVPNGYTTFPVFNIQINNINSYINLKSLTPFTISSDANKYDIFGYFNLNRGKVLQSEFSGYYQQSLGFKQLQFYDMIDCTLTSKYNNIFGTKQIYFFDNNYSKLYIPIALDLNNNVQGLKPFITSSINTNSMEVEINYIYKNKLKQPELLGLSEVLPLYITIDQIDIYSGYFNSLQVYYNDNIKNENTYQLLSNIQFPPYSTFPITTSLDLPSLGFSGESTNLMFKFKDGLGRYSPEQFFHYQYNVSLNAQVLIQQMKGYNISYIGQTTVGGSVTSVNDMTGDVYLTAQNIPYDHSVLSNIDLALDYLFQYGGGVSGSIGSLLQLIFDQPIQEFQIGSTQSANITVSWKYSPRINPTAIHCYIYSSSYPSQTEWHLATESVLTPSDTCLQFQDDISGSLKIVLEYMFGNSGLDTKSSTAYIYFRNNIFFGKSAETESVPILFSTLEHKYLNGNYKLFYSDTVTESKYIFVGYPLHMNTVQPMFVINDIAGGIKALQTIQYVNSSNYIQNYIFYRSQNNNLGYINLTVKNPMQYEI